MTISTNGLVLACGSLTILINHLGICFSTTVSDYVALKFLLGLDMSRKNVLLSTEHVTRSAATTLGGTRCSVRECYSPGRACMVMGFETKLERRLYLAHPTCCKASTLYIFCLR